MKTALQSNATGLRRDSAFSSSRTVMRPRTKAIISSGSKVLPMVISAKKGLRNCASGEELDDFNCDAEQQDCDDYGEHACDQLTQKRAIM